MRCEEEGDKRVDPGDTFCISGNDFQDTAEETTEEECMREYNPKERYCIGEKILHKKFKDSGIVVGKKQGQTTKIIVQFEKVGLKMYVQSQQ